MEITDEGMDRLEELSSKILFLGKHLLLDAEKPETETVAAAVALGELLRMECLARYGNIRAFLEKFDEKEALAIALWEKLRAWRQFNKQCEAKGITLIVSSDQKSLWELIVDERRRQAIYEPIVYYSNKPFALVVDGYRFKAGFRTHAEAQDEAAKYSGAVVRDYGVRIKKFDRETLVVTDWERIDGQTYSIWQEPRRYSVWLPAPD